MGIGIEQSSVCQCLVETEHYWQEFMRLRENNLPKLLSQNWVLKCL